MLGDLAVLEPEDVHDRHARMVRSRAEMAVHDDQLVLADETRDLHLQPWYRRQKRRDARDERVGPVVGLCCTESERRERRAASSGLRWHELLVAACVRRPRREAAV